MGTNMPTAAERDEKRASVARTFAVERDAIEQQYIKDQAELRESYEAELKANRIKWTEANQEEGLNPNGGVLSDSDQGSKI